MTFVFNAQAHILTVEQQRNAVIAVAPRSQGAPVRLLHRHLRRVHCL
ncbi:MAG: hypothetical protein IJ074_07165 [Clostridia bacterium]|nr:hypothetical protein [Clostridia bacterium]